VASTDSAEPSFPLSPEDACERQFLFPPPSSVAPCRTDLTSARELAFFPLLYKKANGRLFRKLFALMLLESFRLCLFPVGCCVIRKNASPRSEVRRV